MYQQSGNKGGANLPKEKEKDNEKEKEKEEEQETEKEKQIGASGSCKTCERTLSLKENQVLIQRTRSDHVYVLQW